MLSISRSGLNKEGRTEHQVVGSRTKRVGLGFGLRVKVRARIAEGGQQGSHTLGHDPRPSVITSILYHIVSYRSVYGTSLIGLTLNLNHLHTVTCSPL